LFTSLVKNAFKFRTSAAENISEKSLQIPQNVGSKDNFGTNDAKVSSYALSFDSGRCDEKHCKGVGL
jgi:hypothetical protein